jgi:pilus assembly protein Flp/PilA
MGMKMSGHDNRGEALADRLRRFADDTRGATAIEYGLIVALLSVALIVTIATLSDNMKTIYTAATNALK